MRKKFVAILMIGGLVIGLCGCGSSGSASTPEPTEDVVSEKQEETLVQDDSTQMSNLAGSSDEAMSEERYLEGYSVNELMEMLSAREITMSDIEFNVAVGSISYNDYEEILSLASPAQEDEVAPEQSAIQAENNDYVGDMDVLSLLTTHVVEYEDRDGYKIRETCQLSPIFTEDYNDTMYSLWEALGNDADLFPSEKALYGASHSMEYARDTDSCDKLEYIIGTYTIENLTDGFPITPDNPRTYIGSLHAEQGSASGEEHDANSNATGSFNFRSVSVAMYSDGTSYYAEQGASILARAKMSSDVWGPTCFIIVLPNGATPNRPDGYRYDKIRIEFGNKSYVDSGYDVFGLAYFK